MNDQLPPSPAWAHRSFWAALLTIAMVICNAAGIDLLAMAARLGLGNSPDEVLDKVQLILPALGVIWLWWERRAPQFRLVWRRLIQ